MGMYNEVRTSCPNCLAACEIQISEIVRGFGEFFISRFGDHSNIEKLRDEADKEMFIEEVNEETFYCKNCEHSFKLHLELGKPPVDGTIYI